MTTTWSTVSGAVVQSVADAAATSATASATSATAAAASATAASGSASSAASEVALATAQVVLGTAQTALATSQASASATSATASAASLAEFNGLYYGSSGTAPTTSVATGDIYFNSSSNQLQVYNGSIWQAGVTATSGLQSVDAGLTSISNLTTSADQMLFLTGSDIYAVTSLTAAGRAILDDADVAAQRTTLGLGTMAVAAAADYAALASPTFTGTVIANNLTVNGTTVTNKATTVLYDDTILELNLDSGSAPTGTTTTDIGMAYHYYSGSAKTAFAGYVNSTGEWTYIPDATLGSAVSGAVGAINVGTVKSTSIEYSDGSSQSSALDAFYMSLAVA